MSVLNKELLEKIEKNREMALLKKQKIAVNINKNESNAASLQTKSFHVDARGNNLPKTSENSRSSQTSSCPAIFRVISENRFTVDMPFHAHIIDLFKTIPGRIYDPQVKKWNFPLTSYSNLISKLSKLVVTTGIPEVVLKVLLAPNLVVDDAELHKIDGVLIKSLLPFQKEGIRFGISKEGRCLIADDMGLGKTIQALGIAHYYKDNWPLLILCPSSVRYQWEQAIQEFLPSVNPFYITVIASRKELIDEAKIVICSYDLLKSFLLEMNTKKFGVLILDESHCLKSFKAKRTRAALELARKCRNVILLSGTPLLSRPIELYPQIIAIDPSSFSSIYDYGVRYCAGFNDKFGMNFSGSSNMEELEIYLRKKIMIRRMKSEVLTQLPSKIRKVVVLNVEKRESFKKQMKKLETDLKNDRENYKDSLIFYYSFTANAKAKAVCEYVGEKLKITKKALVFAHHNVVMDSLCEMLAKKNIGFMRIDGSTRPNARKTSCDKFQNEEDCRVAVLSLRAANSGITLTAAQLVMFAELYWNPGELIQAEDRAHRIGQHNSVLVEYLIAKGTADDYIWNMVQRKLNVLNRAGLSNDSFKEIAIKHLGKNNEGTLESTLVEMKKPQLEEDTFEFFSGTDDGIFGNIELEEIENQYYIENKKRKTDI